MGELEKRTEEQQHEIEDAVLALTEAGWTQREITGELNISSKSIPVYRERAIARVPIPDHDTVVRENLIQIKTKMDDISRRLADPDLPKTATNVPNLYHQWTKQREVLNKALGVGTTSKVDIGIDNTLHGWMMANLDVAEEAMNAGLQEEAQRRDAALNYGDDVGMDDLELDESDGVYKLPSEIEKDAKGDSENNDAYQN